MPAPETIARERTRDAAAASHPLVAEIERALRGLQAAIVREAPYGWIRCGEHDHVIALPSRLNYGSPFRFGDSLSIYVETEIAQVLLPLLRRLGGERITVFADGRHVALFIDRMPVAVLGIARRPDVHPGLAAVARLGLERLLLLNGSACETASAHERLEAERCARRCAEADVMMRDLGYGRFPRISDSRIETVHRGPLLVLLADGEPFASLLLENDVRILPKIPMPALDPDLASIVAAAGEATLVYGSHGQCRMRSDQSDRPLVRIELEDDALSTLIAIGLLCKRPGAHDEYWAVGAPPRLRLDAEEIERLRRASSSSWLNWTFYLFGEINTLARAQRARFLLISPGPRACLTEAGFALLAGARMPPSEDGFLPLGPDCSSRSGPSRGQRPIRTGAAA